MVGLITFARSERSGGSAQGLASPRRGDMNRMRGSAIVNTRVTRGSSRTTRKGVPRHRPKEGRGFCIRGCQPLQTSGEPARCNRVAIRTYGSEGTVINAHWLNWRESMCPGGVSESYILTYIRGGLVSWIKTWQSKDRLYIEERKSWDNNRAVADIALGLGVAAYLLWKFYANDKVSGRGVAVSEPHFIAVLHAEGTETDVDKSVETMASSRTCMVVPLLWKA